jgi:hypothetical protein
MAVDLIADDLSKSLDAEVREGEGFDAVDIVHPQGAVFGLELIGQAPQEVFVAAQQLGSAADREDVAYCRHGSGDGGLPSGGLPLPRQQLAEPSLRGDGDARQHVVAAAGKLTRSPTEN